MTSKRTNALKYMKVYYTHRLFLHFSDGDALHKGRYFEILQKVLNQFTDMKY